MFHRIRKHTNPALPISLIALFVALGGTSYAVTQLPKGSVGPKQLKNGAVTTKKISKKTRRALKGARGVAGPVGPAGPQGPAGTPGSPGATDVVVRRDVGTPIGTGSWYTFIVKCEPGERAVGGGAGFDGNSGTEELQQSYPTIGNGTRPDDGDVPTGWLSIIRNDGASPKTPSGYAICARP